MFSIFISNRIWLYSLFLDQSMLFYTGIFHEVKIEFLFKHSKNVLRIVNCIIRLQRDEAPAQNMISTLKAFGALFRNSQAYEHIRMEYITFLLFGIYLPTRWHVNRHQFGFFWSAHISNDFIEWWSNMPIESKSEYGINNNVIIWVDVFQRLQDGSSAIYKLSN